MTRGGGFPLFRIRYGKIMKIMGAFTEKSLSRIEKGEPSPVFGGTRPGVDDEDFTGYDTIVVRMTISADGEFQMIFVP